MPARSRKKAKLDTLLKSVETPLFVLDRKRAVVYFNHGCEILTGWSAGEVVGRTCEYASEADTRTVAALTCSLCPPPEVYDGHSVAVRTEFPNRDGGSELRLVSYFALSDDQSRVAYVLGVVTPVEQSAVVSKPSVAQKLHAQLAAVRRQLRQQYNLSTLIGQSEPMLRVLEQAKLATLTRTPVFLEGEAGTGKEHIARAVHNQSDVGDGAFVPIDCRRTSAIDLKLTLRRLLKNTSGEGDDDAGQPSPFEPRSLYLSDVEHLPRDLQEMLTEAFRAEANGRASTLRLMVSSTVDPRSLLEGEQLRSDFFYLVTGVHVRVPPLRDRGDDLLLLAQAMLEKLNRGNERQSGGFADEVWAKFREYRWPGNLDELTAVVAEAREAADGDTVHAGHLPFRFRAGLDAQAVGPKVAPPIRPLEDVLHDVEVEQIQQALEQADQNKSQAAKLLGMTRPRLYRRMQALGIDDLEQSGNDE